jgi:hypothetical protein
MFLDPGQERAGIVKAKVNARMLFELFEKWEIGSFIGLFQDMAKIAARLVGVNEQSEMEVLRHGDSFFSQTS